MKAINYIFLTWLSNSVVKILIIFHLTKQLGGTDILQQGV